jgi:protein-disulfide isomerase
MKKELAKKILISSFAIITVSALLGTLILIIPQKNQKGGNFLAEKAITQINKILAPFGKTAQLISFQEESQGYKVNFKIDDKEYSVFMTKDGKYLFPTEANLMTQEEPGTSTQSQNNAQNQPSTQNPEKREKPDVKVFVMSYCPFGLQMEKAILPVWKLLKDKADFGIYFVDYIMHGKKEMEENLRQYCIEKEQKEKYLSYLECFVKEGNSENCLTQAKIDKNKLKNCQSSTDKEFKISENFTETGYPPFNVHKDLNEKYGVKGSPTLVINDKVIEVSERSPEKIKEVICNAFLNPPKECQEKLSDEVLSPGFGMTTGSISSGKCE